MKIKVLFMTLALILVVLISGCKKNDYVAAVGVCPIVVSTIPANGAVGVPLNQVVSATFNEKMNPNTITGSSFTLTALSTVAGVSTTTPVAGDVTYSGLTAFFKPTNPLTPNTTFTGRVTTMARDLMGNALQTDYVWSFATDLAPTVASDPANNATGVLLNKVIVATFSVPMDSLTLKNPATNFTIKQGTTTVPGKFSYASKTASFTPTVNLAPFTVYTGTILKGVNNMLGTSMAADYVWSFTTIPQLTLSSLPVLGGTTSGAGLFAQGSSVTVIATANAGFTFFNWTDGATVASTSATYQLTMAGNKTLVANFTPKYVVTVLSNPLLGGTTSGGGSFNSGSSVTVTAVPSTGFTFTNWTEGVNVASTAASYQFTISANRSLTANYAPIPYTVSVSSNPISGGTSTGGGIFNFGTSVTVSAVPSPGFTFTNWTEGANIVSSSASYQFTIAGNRTLVANYTAIPYTVIVSSLPVLGGVTTGGGTFNSGASVTVSASANAGFTFTNWTEGINIVSTNANYQFTIAGNRTLVANYAVIPYTVAVSSKPLLGGTTTGGGTFNSGTSVTVTAIPNPGFTFTNWTEGLIVVSSASSYQFIIAGNRTLVANYTAIPFTVTVSSLPVLGGVTTGGGIYNSGASVTVTASANAGYTFTNWTEGINIVSTSANYQFTIAGNRTLVANYNANPLSVTVSSNPLAGGTTYGGGVFNSGSVVIVHAAANVGYTFMNWTEGLVVASTNADYQFTISGSRILVANYIPITYTLAVSSNPLAGGITTGGGTFNSGAPVTATAAANPGYNFTNWTENGIIVPGALATYTFNIAGNRTLVANYTAVIGFTVAVSSNPLAGGITTGGGIFSSGASVTVTAAANPGYNFTNWTEGLLVASTNANYLFTISGNRILVANYTASIIPPAPLFTSRFGIFGGTAGMTNQGTLTKIVGGDIGTIATGTSAITGFHDSNGDIYTETGSNIGGVSGLILTCTVSTTGPTSAVVNAANCSAATVGRNAILAAYNALAGMPVSGVLLPANLSGLTVAPGVYKAPAGSFMIQDGLPGPAGDLTLSGTATDVWVFQMSTTLTVGGPGAAFPRSVILTGGALAKNVYWQVGSAATINAGGGGTMEGTIISQAGVAISTAGNVAIATLNGRALSLGASVTLVNTIINVPAP
jgi:hypothetical protein